MVLLRNLIIGESYPPKLGVPTMMENQMENKMENEMETVGDYKAQTSNPT